MSEMIKRSLSGAAYVIIMLASVYAPVIYLKILFGVFVLIGSIELFSLNARTEPDVPLWWVLLPLVFYFGLAWPIVDTGFGLVLTVLVLLFIMIHTLLQQEISSYTAVGRIVFTSIYVALPFILAIRLHSRFDFDGLPMLGGLYLLVWSNDTFAYLTGRMLGKTPMAPKISPNKTVEGLIGGFLGTLVVAAIINMFNAELGSVGWISLAIIATSFGSLGDLFESKLKREAQVKDSGYLFPGHGGLLDRIDSLLFVLPATYIIFDLFIP